MSNMFCFQCQQTAGGSACINTGVCGKQPSTSNLQDELVCELIKLAELSKNENKHSAVADRLIIDGLFTTLTNVNFDNNAIKEFMGRVKNEQNKISRPEAEKIQVINLWDGDTDIVSLRSTLLFGLKGMAAYAHHAMNLGYTDNAVLKWFYKGLCEVNREHSVTEWIELIMEFGQVNFKCMELLDKANTESFGNPVPTRVNVDIKKGPFIVVSGHDLNDLSQLLEQTEKTGVNVYTHCEMLPAHGYPELNKYHNLAGNFGTAWQSQQTEFENIPAPVLFTTNCLMPPRPSYKDRIYTTSVVGYDGMVHISELSWSRIKNPAEVVSIGDHLDVYVISFDPEKRKISLGVKDRTQNPWDVFMNTYKVGDVANVRIVKLMTFGAFAEVVPGVDGLIHISQIADRRIDKPSDVLSEGQMVDAKITAIDEEKKKISLSIRALLSGEEEAPVEE